MKIDNAMAVFKETPKTNCRECGAKTCLAFAGAVFQRHKSIGDCLHLDKAVLDKFSDGVKLPKAHRAYLDEFKKMRHACTEKHDGNLTGLLLFNNAADGFDAQVTILHQRRAEHFLDAECRVMVDGHFLEVIK